MFYFVQSDIVIEKGKLLLRKLYLTFATDKWNSMDDVKNIYFPNQKLPKPAVIFILAAKCLFSNDCLFSVLNIGPMTSGLVCRECRASTPI